MRNWITWAGGFLLCLLSGFMVVMFSLNPANSLGELLTVATFLTVVCYLISLFTMFSYVRATSSGLVVVNPGALFRISWRDVRKLSTDQGLSIELAGGKVDSFAFQASLAGRVLGYPGARRAARKIERVRVKGVGTGEGRDVGPVVPWRRHVSWIVAIWVTFALIIPLSIRFA